jgi:hypothetical protein
MAQRINDTLKQLFKKDSVTIINHLSTMLYEVYINIDNMDINTILNLTQNIALLFAQYIVNDIDKKDMCRNILYKCNEYVYFNVDKFEQKYIENKNIRYYVEMSDSNIKKCLKKNEKISNWSISKLFGYTKLHDD